MGLQRMRGAILDLHAAEFGIARDGRPDRVFRADLLEWRSYRPDRRAAIFVASAVPRWRRVLWWLEFTLERCWLWCVCR